ncbi:Ger(x)C family spore germination protein [Paenibacillus aurantius]|uniref:Ger(X)C family spore germination protein n=1 Tax=Paenibacillus aurantius TaxID=2918900 RepID=A0AA96LJB8_9BACL|nr:Ger(x)C family spore germination protein [Paenibacillus aurantius]WNQ12542.1 Ger(x)C family spore germination protein [Paenibacillus aurantius]
MIRFVLLACVSLTLALISSGCTDFVEPNQLAGVLGTAIDHGEDGMIEVSHQIVIPSQLEGPSKGGGSGNSNPFLVMSATGQDVFQATQKIQFKMSRRLITNHRSIIAISEEYFRRNDVRKLFDKLFRDPANNLRDIIVLIKGSSAKEFIMLKHPIESLSSIGAAKELQINGMSGFSSRQFLIDSFLKGSRPLIPVLQIESLKRSPKKTDPTALLSGFAVLDHNLKIKGLLDVEEGSGALWMMGKGTYHGATVPWKNGIVSLRLTQLHRRISSAAGQDPKRIVLTVKAQAYLLENSSQRDMSEADNMVELQKGINEQIQKELQGTIDKVQRWGPDVFGIGEYLHRQNPYWWKSQEDDWDEKFKNIDVSVKADILLRSTGVSGAPLK